MLFKNYNQARDVPAESSHIIEEDAKDSQNLNMHSDLHA